MAWWDAEECGGFDLTDLWGVDAEIAADMVTVFGLVAGHHSYPHMLGYEEEFARIIAGWRPSLKG